MKLLLLTVFLTSFLPAAPIEVPGSTAYLDPNHRGARVSDAGISRWTDPKISITWFGQFQKSGKVHAKVKLNLKCDSTLKLTLTVAGKAQEISVTGKGAKTIADFGEFEIKKPGYQSFRLTSPKPAGIIKALTLDGAIAGTAHFNLKPRRNAASVHLAYPTGRAKEITAFYAEMTGVEDPLWTYYMACGWHRGYFGMQVNSPTERRIIFSVWDSGGEAIDRNKVGDSNRVKLVGKGEGVYTGSFGNEGTGGHSHLKFNWKTGEKQKFLVTAKPVDATHTIFSGYYFHPGKKEWMLISSWNAPKEGGYLRGLYSFSENFGGQNGHVGRKALYGNQWIQFSDGKWQEQTRATFSHDGTGKKDRLDRFMGLDPDGQFFLSQGGFRKGFTKFGQPFDRPATGKSPDGIKLPEPK
jgi:hypothetical protein